MAITEQGILPLSPWEVADWSYDTNTGYYLHRGHVYICSEASAFGPGDFPGSATLLSGINSELRPTSAVHCKVLIDHNNAGFEYAYDSGLMIGPWLDVTVNTDGTITLDAGNPHNGRTDSTLVLILSAITWPTPDAIADTYSPSSLDPNISTSANIVAYYGVSGGYNSTNTPDDFWQNVDGTYESHDSRLHLNGSVKGGPFDPALPFVQPDNWAPLIELLKSNGQFPQLSSETGGFWWTEIPTPAGYRCGIYSSSYTPGPLDYEYVWCNGAQNPQAVGNNGCGVFQQNFYADAQDGYIYRGHHVTPVSFTPGTADTGLTFDHACNGYPIAGPFPSSVDWQGSVVEGHVNCASVYNLVQFDPNIPSDPIAIASGDQMCWISGLNRDGIGGYYKIVPVCYLPFSGAPPGTLPTVVIFVYRVACGGAQVLLMEGNPDSAFANEVLPDGSVQVDFFFQTSNQNIGGGVLTGKNYVYIRPPYRTVNQGVDDFTTAGVSLSEGGIGDVAVYVPSGGGFTGISTSVNGTGEFPEVDHGDVLDLTGCGYPLAFAAPTDEFMDVV